MSVPIVMRKSEKTELTPDVIVEYSLARKAELQRLLTEKEEAVRTAPEGKIRIVKRDYSLQYYHRKEACERNGAYLKRAQDSLASALAQKDYDFTLINELKVEIHAIDKLLDNYRPEQIEKIYSSLHENRKPLVCPVILPDDDYVKRWMSVEYKGKSFNDNTTEYYTAKKERVRSKSEIIIANTLNRLKIPYRYEYPIHIPGIGTVHSDFVCLNIHKRKEYIWEHFGMMADSDYAENAVNKIEKYTLAGYYPGDNLILSFESTSRPLSAWVIEHNIQKYLI